MTAIKQPDNGGITIGCCLCFCLTGIKRPATPPPIEGYSVCDEHAQWMTQPFNDFADLVRRVKHNTTRNAT